MESSRVSVAHKRKLSGPSTWPRVLKAAPKREPPRASLSGRLDYDETQAGIFRTESSLTQQSCSGRLTERQQLALALEESRKDSLPQQQDQQVCMRGSGWLRVPVPSGLARLTMHVSMQGAEHALQRCDSGEQSSSLRCCDDEIAAHHSSSSKRRLKQQHGRKEDGMPSSPCRTNSHEQASTSG